MTAQLTHLAVNVMLPNGYLVPVQPDEVVVLWLEGDLPTSVPEDLIGSLPRHTVDGLALGTRVLVNANGTWLGGRISG